jgi:hypothetical protein
LPSGISRLNPFGGAWLPYDAIRYIVLVSTIGERLGLGVRGPGIDEDVLMDNLRTSMATALITRGMEEEEARAISSGVRRSRIGRERECLAFGPASVDLQRPDKLNSR